RQGFAVFSHAKIDEPPAFLPANIQRDAFRLLMEVMKSDERVVPPLIPNRENTGVSGLERLVGAPSKLRTLFSQPDHALRPIQHRVRIAPLRFDVHPLI